MHAPLGGPSNHARECICRKELDPETLTCKGARSFPFCIGLDVGNAEASFLINP